MTRECIENMREVVLPFLKKKLLEIDYEGKGKSDAEEFEKDFNELLNMAAKTLEQELCEEWCGIPADRMTLEQARCAIRDFRKFVMSFVMSQKTSWIPVSERLPKVADCYSVTREIGGDLIVSACYFDGINNWHDDKWINYERNYLTDVVAWMPALQPYKAKSEDEVGK